MKTKIREIHSEEYSDNTKTLGVLLNYSIDTEHKDWHDSLIYVYNHERKTYVFFNTLIEMIDYQFYGDRKIKCAYLNEAEFDNYFDAEYLDDKFSEILKWV